MDYSEMTVDELNRRLVTLEVLLGAGHCALDATPAGELRLQRRIQLSNMRSEAIVIRSWLRIKWRQALCGARH